MVQKHRECTFFSESMPSPDVVRRCLVTDRPEEPRGAMRPHTVQRDRYIQNPSDDWFDGWKWKCFTLKHRQPRILYHRWCTVCALCHIVSHNTLLYIGRRTSYTWSYLYIWSIVWDKINLRQNFCPNNGFSLPQNAHGEVKDCLEQLESNKKMWQWICPIETWK